ncbi:MAG TPA: hypothetical protein VFX46_07955 [Hyphomicrobiaceae bacterium]|nr:hypothetical protein [Hyphomicrobiaceae bacterium]
MLKALVVLAVGLAAQVKVPTGLPPIERYGVGSVVIGADAQQVYDAFAGRRELVDLGYEGMLTPALLLRFVGLTQRDGVVAELDSGSLGLVVWRIEIRDPAFRTVKGIGVGSTVGQLKSAYPLDAVLSGEGSVAIRVKALSASFELDQTGPDGSKLSGIRDPALVPASVTIRSVLLTR